MGLELSSSLCLFRFCADRFGRICRMPDKDHGETDLIGHGDRKREKKWRSGEGNVARKGKKHAVTCTVCATECVLI